MKLHTQRTSSHSLHQSQITTPCLHCTRHRGFGSFLMSTAQDLLGRKIMHIPSINFTELRCNVILLYSRIPMSVKGA